MIPMESWSVRKRGNSAERGETRGKSGALEALLSLRTADLGKIDQAVTWLFFEVPSGPVCPTVVQNSTLRKVSSVPLIVSIYQLTRPKTYPLVGSIPRTTLTSTFSYTKSSIPSCAAYSLQKCRIFVLQVDLQFFTLIVLVWQCHTQPTATSFVRLSFTNLTWQWVYPACSKETQNTLHYNPAKIFCCWWWLRLAWVPSRNRARMVAQSLHQTVLFCGWLARLRRPSIAYTANSALVAGQSYLERTEKTHRIILISVGHTDPVVLELAPSRSIDCFRWYVLLHYRIHPNTALRNSTFA